MKKISQKESDKLWDYYQNEGVDSFESGYSRLKFLARKCKKGGRVLNIGIGSGYFESLLIKQGVNVYSIDPSKKTVQKLSRKLGMHRKVKIGHCHNIPFPDNYFDYVVMTEVLEHIPDEFLQKSIGEVRRVLNKKGIFFGTVPYKESLSDNEVICPNCYLHFHRWGHNQSFDLSSLRNLLQGNGFYFEKLQVRAFCDFSRLGLLPLIRSISRYTLGRMREKIVNPNIFFYCRTNSRQSNLASK
ncbi:SmtA SAM-dependent methyltransferases [Candidatus Methylopumilus universalis]|uniref:class I SAM-dependent methyltransferase n=1 Tax=Candidatus Methylopumilus universalis TaxID=2588536 RepID=UPI003BEEB3DC